MGSSSKANSQEGSKFQIDIATLFPAFFESPLQQSILKRAQQDQQLQVRVHNIRDYAHDKHQTVDDKPFGGGPGMVMKPEPIFECIESITPKKKTDQKDKKDPWVILLDPAGESLTQSVAAELATHEHLVLIAGHYEGVDYRVREHLVDQEISVGDYVTMGGEAPALCLIEAVVRLIPGVLGNEDSIKDESFQESSLEYPQYTRPREYRGMKVPDVLVSGHHREVEQWRSEVAKKMTKKVRPDLID